MDSKTIKTQNELKDLMSQTNYMILCFLTDKHHSQIPAIQSRFEMTNGLRKCSKIAYLNAANFQEAAKNYGVDKMPALVFIENRVFLDEKNPETDDGTNIDEENSLGSHLQNDAVLKIDPYVAFKDMEDYFEKCEMAIFEKDSRTLYHAENKEYIEKEIREFLKSEPVMLFIEREREKDKDIIEKALLEMENFVKLGNEEVNAKAKIEKAMNEKAMNEKAKIEKAKIEKAEIENKDIESILKERGVVFEVYDVDVNKEIKEAIMKVSERREFPQLFIDGKLFAWSTQIKTLAENGELLKALPEACKTEKFNEKLKQIINSARIVLFMKGSAEAPRCGFSKSIVALLKKHCDFSKENVVTFDVLEDEKVRQGLKEYSGWKTYPQLYVNGELVGGLDIVKELEEEGDLDELLKRWGK